ncbi:MAG TPA: PsiF family protein [Casimicrobiaceae bacterium]|nr:PsiF family protein [Casimicrobiaceae bacterium]
MDAGLAIVAEAVLHRTMRRGNNMRRRAGKAVAGLRRPSYTESARLASTHGSMAPFLSDLPLQGVRCMKSLISFALALALAGTAIAASGQSTAPATKPAAPAAANPQNERMKVCNEKATGKKGDERKSFMSDCLAGKEPEKKLTASQQRMKDCNIRATGKTGDDRKKFMAECLKN